MRILDFHTHLDDRWLHKPIPDVSRMIAAMDRLGVERACVYTMMGFYGDCPRHNDLLLERSRRYPDRLIPFVTVDPKEGPAAVNELERCLQQPEFRGIKFHPWLQAFASSMLEETMTAILEVAARTSTPVLFHDGTPPYSTTYQVADLARWVPAATVFLGHAGLADYVDPAARLIRDIPNLYGCFCGSRPGDLVHLVATAGSDKITFGSDFDPGCWEMLAERLDNTIEAGLAPQDLEAVLWRNAERILRPSRP
ncbi:amidohydrolase family protein [Aquisphaera insulae]|uniref:amidohydrolase family protein n=1 Tax=Aquisphaera insulae TaxID=2712864 RepID=UPI0013EA7EB8|nr:amidohydrolase family protein [Aquisphaera insulae]